jgi:tellurite methyltransferase
VGNEDQERWDARYRARGPATWDPDGFLVEVAHLLPTRGRALDVAGGRGRHALWLAARGLDVTLLDVSPVALGIAEAEARARGLDIKTAAVDLENEQLPAGPFDVIADFHYLQRELFVAFAERLAPGGLLVFVQPTRRNLERHKHPSERFLLAEGEIGSLVEDLEIISLAEDWSPAGRHEARLLARRV